MKKLILLALLALPMAAQALETTRASTLIFWYEGSLSSDPMYDGFRETMSNRFAGYITGVMDLIQAYPVYTKNCGRIDNITISQVRKAVERYLTSNPGVGREPAPNVIYRAFAESFCPKEND